METQNIFHFQPEIFVDRHYRRWAIDGPPINGWLTNNQWSIDSVRRWTLIYI